MSFFDPPGGADVVRRTREFDRVRSLPRRAPGDKIELTGLLKTPIGRMSLRPIQAQALYDIGTQGGLFGPLRVGAGKTLISLLAPVVAGATRPLLLVPAALVEKTNRDRESLSIHWDLPRAIRIMSYEMLSQVKSANILDAYQPDLIIADEAHKLRNASAACTARVTRYMQAHPRTGFVAISGTITKRSIMDYSHMLKWCLPAHKVPQPLVRNELELWADALDERKNQSRRADPGALLLLCDESERGLPPRAAARSAYRRRLVETPGVVASRETPIDAGLLIRSVAAPVNGAIDAAFEQLRETWTTPDDWDIADAVGVYRHARELALGFYYKWDPRPPRDWLEARSDWYRYARQAIGKVPMLDTEAQVREAVDAGQLLAGVGPLARWRTLRDTFAPNVVAVWIDPSIPEWCAEWGHREGGIVWSEHRCFGQALRRAGLPYYGSKGLDEQGRYIEDHPHGKGLGASIKSNSEGRNLQHKWYKNLVVSPPPNGTQWEQMLGRTHRDGQKRDCVSVDVLIHCVEHRGAVDQAVADSEYVSESTGAPQKLLLATLDMESSTSAVARKGARWIK